MAQQESRSHKHTIPDQWSHVPMVAVNINAPHPPPIDLATPPGSLPNKKWWGVPKIFKSNFGAVNINDTKVIV